MQYIVRGFNSAWTQPCIHGLHTPSHIAPSGREAQEQGFEQFRESSPALAQGIGGGASNSRQKVPESSSLLLPKPVPKH